MRSNYRFQLRFNSGRVNSAITIDQLVVAVFVIVRSQSEESE